MLVRKGKTVEEYFFYFTVFAKIILNQDKLMYQILVKDSF